MTLVRTIGIVLIVVGLAALIYRGIDYSSGPRRVDLGPVELEVKKRERIQIPVWVGASAIGIGTLLLLLRRK